MKPTKKKIAIILFVTGGVIGAAATSQPHSWIDAVIAGLALIFALGACCDLDNHY